MKREKQQQQQPIEGTPLEEEPNSTDYIHSWDFRKKNHHPTSGFGGAFVLIVLGALLLLNNFGLVPWNIWRDLWKFWPLFLIFWGLQLIFGRSRIANILLLLISLLVVGYFLLVTVATSNPQFNNYLRQNYPIWNNVPQPPAAPEPPKSPRQLDFGDDDNNLELP